MEPRQAIEIIGLNEMVRRSGVARVTVQRARSDNRFAPTKAGRKMQAVVAAEGLGNGVEPGDQPDLPIQDPLLIQIKRAELAKKEADASEKERKNAEAEGRLLPAADIAAAYGYSTAHSSAPVWTARAAMLETHPLRRLPGDRP